MSKQTRTLFHIPLPGNDYRDNVINQHLDTLGPRRKAQWAKDIMYRAITGLLVPIGPVVLFDVPLMGISQEAPWKLTLKIRAATEAQAMEKALEFIRDNYPDFAWQVRYEGNGQ